MDRHAQGPHQRHVRRRRSQVAGHDGCLRLRHLPPTRWKGPVVVLGRREGIAGGVLITIGWLIGIVKHGRREWRVEVLHMHLGQVRS